MSSYRISGTIGRTAIYSAVVYPLMFHQTLKTMNMLCVCPECKNTVDLSRYPNISAGMVIECDHCGMTLAVKEVSADGNIKTEIVDEGK